MIKLLTIPLLLFSLEASALSVTYLSDTDYSIKFDSLSLKDIGIKTGGHYSPVSDEAFIRLRKQKEYQKVSTFHEICHHISAKKTTKFFRHKYEKAYDLVNYNPRRYSKGDTSENFADVCTWMIMNYRYPDNAQTRLMQTVLDKPGVKYLIKTYVR